MVINIYKEYTFMDDNYSKYCLSVENDFTDIEYYEYSNGDHKWHKQDDMKIDSKFAYEIAKKIVEEYERMNNNGLA